MKPTKRELLLKQLEETIAERKEYLQQIEADIESVTMAGNNQLLIMKGEVDQLEQKKASLMRENYSLLQKIREHGSQYNALR